MITDKDSQKLIKDFKKVIATKDDLKSFATKDDLKSFATKDDLKSFATKDDLKSFATKDDLKSFATKDQLKAEIKGLVRSINFVHKDLSDAIQTIVDMMNEHWKRMDKTDERNDKKFNEMLKKIDEQGRRQDEILVELRANRIVVGNHEKRLQKVEDRVFPQ